MDVTAWSCMLANATWGEEVKIGRSRSFLSGRVTANVWRMCVVGPTTLSIGCCRSLQWQPVLSDGQGKSETYQEKLWDRPDMDCIPLIEKLNLNYRRNDNSEAFNCKCQLWQYYCWIRFQVIFKVRKVLRSNAQTDVIKSDYLQA